jgi:NitT/TauT family transport system substrate-binding protein
MTKLARPLAFVLMTATMATGSAVFAQDTLRLTVGQRGLWDTSISDVGQRAGIFKKHGVTLDILYTQGSGETQQAVFAGSVDIGVSVGVMGALAGYSKGAPVRIIGNEITGAGDVYWYVKSDSPIKTIKDFDGKTIAFSTIGASTHGVVTAFIKQYGLTAAKPTQTGGPAPTLTAVMSGQVDVGWAAPPFGLDQLDRKEIRQIATGNDTTFKDQTTACDYPPAYFAEPQGCDRPIHEGLPRNHRLDVFRSGGAQDICGVCGHHRGEGEAHS